MTIDWTTLHRRIVDLRAEGHSIAEVARRLGISSERLRCYLISKGLHKASTLRQDREWTLIEKQQLIELRAQKMAFRDIARVLDRHYDTVRAMYRYLTTDRESAAISDRIPEPRPHIVVGRRSQPIEYLVERIGRLLAQYGTLAVVNSQTGVIAAAIPSTRVERKAQREGAVICTYSTDARDPRYAPTSSQLRQAIAEDLREVCA